MVTACKEGVELKKPVTLGTLLKSHNKLAQLNHECARRHKALADWANEK